MEKSRNPTYIGKRKGSHKGCLSVNMLFVSTYLCATKSAREIFKPAEDAIAKERERERADEQIMKDAQRHKRTIYG